MAKQWTPPQQEQEHQPGVETMMEPRPESEMEHYRGANKLLNKKTIITGGDSGIGKATAIAFAKEGADCVIVYLEEHKDAERTRELVENAGRKCILMPGDVGDSAFCRKVIEMAADEFGKIDVLVNNAGIQYPLDDFTELTDEQLHKTFQVNLFSMFYTIREALKHMPAGGSIINTTSITAYEGNPSLIDYSSTKGGIVSLTRSLSRSLAPKIRVNAVAPGPIWTPLIPSSFSGEKVKSFGASTDMGRPGQPDEVAPCYVFLASDDSSYITAQTLHPNGGRFVTS